MKALIRKFLPKPMKNALRSSLESWRLNRIPIQKVKTVPLPDSAAISFGKLLGGDDLSGEWEAARKMISGIFEYVDKGGAINPGDRRVLYYLVRRFKPQSVLEVGTHLGGSTLHIAMALKACRHVGTPPPRLITLDVKDVNDPDARLWTQYGVSASAREMLVRLDCADLVEFTIALSLDYLAKSETQFDFIFLDGSHEARVVYQEIPLVLKALRSGGCLLMHDYYPEGKALWANGVVIPGPYLAVRRLGRDGAGIRHHRPASRRIAVADQTRLERHQPSRLGEEIVHLRFSLDSDFLFAEKIAKIPKLAAVPTMVVRIHMD